MVESSVRDARAHVQLCTHAAAAGSSPPTRSQAARHSAGRTLLPPASREYLHGMVPGKRHTGLRAMSAWQGGSDARLGQPDGNRHLIDSVSSSGYFSGTAASRAWFTILARSVM